MAPVLPFIYVNGPLNGELKVAVQVPTLSVGGPPLVNPVTQMTLFYSLTDISTYDLDSLFALPETQVARKTVSVSPVVGILTVPVSFGGEYLTPPTVVFTGGGGSGAVTTAVLVPAIPNFTVDHIDITNPGSGYATPPLVSFTGGGEVTPAVATATIGTTAPFSVTFDLTGLAPGIGYFLRAAAAV